MRISNIAATIRNIFIRNNILKTDDLLMVKQKINFNNLCIISVLANYIPVIIYTLVLPGEKIDYRGLMAPFTLGTIILSVFIYQYIINKKFYNNNSAFLKSFIVISFVIFLVYETSTVGGFSYNSIEMILIFILIFVTAYAEKHILSVGLIVGCLIICYHMFLYIYYPDFLPDLMRSYNYTKFPFKDELWMFLILYVMWWIIIQTFTKSTNKYEEIITEENERNKYELKVAKEILEYSNQPIPKSFYKNYHIDIYERSFSEIGGDFYKAFKIKQKHYIYLIDVCGHGVDAALFVMYLKRELNIAICSDIYKTVKHFSDSVREYLELVDKTATITAIEIDNKKMRYINNGNYIFVKSKKDVDILQNNGYGLLNDYIVHEINIESKDKLVIATDGLVEGMDKNNNEFGIKSVGHIIKNCDNIKDSLVQGYKEHTDDIVQDDITIIVMGLKNED